MGKKRDASADATEEELGVDVVAQSPHKKHKKHKHKKHKKKKTSPEEEADLSPDISLEDETPKPALKLKIRIGSQTLGEKNVTSTPVDEKEGEKDREKDGDKEKTDSASKSSPNKVPSTSTPKSSKSKGKKGKGKGNDTSSDEEKWLDAIESGKLHEVDEELKKMKDPKLMTARQRAMFERKTEKEPSPGGEPLMSLPSGYKEKVVTEEMLKKRALKSLKRRELAQQKREKDKKKTMERLLRKQESKAAKAIGKLKGTQKTIPQVTYRNQTDMITISLPVGMEFPLKTQTYVPPPHPSFCEVSGCSNPKKYSCSKTGVALCSLACYKKNLQRHSYLNSRNA